MLWGATLRSPHPHARIRSIEIARGARDARRRRGADPRGRARAARRTGSSTPTSRCSRGTRCATRARRSRSSPPTTPRPRAGPPRWSRSSTRCCRSSTTPSWRCCPTRRSCTPAGNLLRHVPIRHGDAELREADVVVERRVRGRHAGPGVPRPGVGARGAGRRGRRRPLHRDAVAARRPRPARAEPRARPEQVRVTLAGVGGAFGAREDLSMQIHACLLALHTDRPVKLVYGREESFFGHVHRHPARMQYAHGATRDGKLVFVRARIVLDGGAYASSSGAVVANAACFAVGPYDLPERARSTATSSTPTTRRAARCAASARCRRASPTSRRWTGSPPRSRSTRSSCGCATRWSRARGCRPARPSRARRRSPSCSSALRAMPLPDDAPAAARPARAAGRRRQHHPRRGRAAAASATALGFKNIGFSEGFDDYSTARVRLSIVGAEPQVEVHTAAAEVGQGLVTIEGQIARTELGVARVVVVPADTQVGSAGSSSASRQTWMTGGAVKYACDAVRERVLLLAQRAPRRRRARAGATARCAAADGGGSIGLAELLGDTAIEETFEHHHRPTSPLDADDRARATRTSPTRTRRTARSSTSTASSGSSASCRSPRCRTSARRSTRRPSRGRSRAAPRRGSGSR